MKLSDFFIGLGVVGVAAGFFGVAFSPNDLFFIAGMFGGLSMLIGILLVPFSNTIFEVKE